MLRWKVRYTPLLVTAVLVIAALASGRGTPINLGW
jgi:hypothetical protein